MATMKYWETIFRQRDDSAESVQAKHANEKEHPFVPVIISEVGTRLGDKNEAVAELSLGGTKILLFKNIELATVKLLLRAIRETAH